MRGLTTPILICDELSIISNVCNNALGICASDFVDACIWCNNNNFQLNYTTVFDDIPDNLKVEFKLKYL